MVTITLWKRVLLIFFLTAVLIGMSYRNTIQREGIENNTKYSETEQEIAYKNAATIELYTKAQCSSKDLDELDKKLDSISDQLQAENELSEQ